MPSRSPLTREQHIAATTPASRAFIVAAPGSGKTRVAAERFGVIRYDGSTDRRRILALSFARSAKSELAARIQDRWGSKALVWPHQALTLDALHCEILSFLLRRRIIYWLGDHTALTVIDNWRGQIGARRISPEMTYRRTAVLHGNTVGSMSERIGRIGHSEYEIIQKAKFEDHLTAGLCTHAEVRQIIGEALNRQDLRNKVTAYLASTTKAIIVDEVFDANRLDLELIRLAAAAGIATTLIGDPWQALYEFRGARPDLVPGLVEREAFQSFHVTRPFRFQTPEMVQIATNLRIGRPTQLASVSDVAACDVVLAHYWDDLWSGPDCVLPLSYGRLDNQTDAAIALLLDRLVQGHFGHQSIYATEAAALLGLDPDTVRNNGAVFGSVLEMLRPATPDAGARAIAELRRVIKVLGSLRRLRALPSTHEARQQDRLLALARRMDQPHVIPGMTVHQAKGREWSIVGIRLTETEVSRLAEGLKQDRFDDRLLYVAITRATRKVMRC